MLLWKSWIYEQMIKNKFFILYFFIPIVSHSQNWVPLDKGFNSFVRCVYHDSLSGLIYAERFGKRLTAQ